jgi:hypothetical protein
MSRRKRTRSWRNGWQPHEDLYQRYKLYEAVRNIIDDARPFLRAHRMDPQAVEAALTEPTLWA